MLFRIPAFRALSSTYCMTDGLTCFDGSTGDNHIGVVDLNSDDKFTPVYSMDTRYGGGPGLGMGRDGQSVPFSGNENPFPHA